MPRVSKTPRTSPIDSNKFGSPQAQTKYETYGKSRPIVVERKAILSDFSEYKLAETFDRLGWTPLTALEGEVYTEGVRVFYANAHADLEDDEDFDMELEPFFFSYYEGKVIKVTAALIREVTGLETPAAIPPPFPSDMDRAVISSVLCASKDLSMHNNIPVTSLSPYFRVLTRFLMHNLLPKSGHYSSCSWEVADIMYLISTEFVFNTAAVIVTYMKHALLSNVSVGSIPFGIIISRILLWSTWRTSLPLSLGREPIPAPYSRTSLARMHVGSSSGSEPQSSATSVSTRVPRTLGGVAEALEQIIGTLAGVTTRLTALETDVAAIRRFVVTEEEEQAGSEEMSDI